MTFAVEGDGEWIKFAAGQPVIRDLLRPGATVVVDVEAGGHDTWCWNPGSTEPVQEVLDFVERRIHATVVSKRRLESLRLWSSESVREAFASMVSAADGTSSDLEEALRVVVDSLHSVPVSSTYQQLYTQQLTGIVGQSDSSAEVIILTPEVEDFDEDVADRHDGESSGTASGDLVFLITRGRRAVRRVDAAQLGVGDQSDDATSRTAREPVSLDSHLTAVGERAAAMAAALGVDARLVELVRRAADLHDLGKADRRFQTILRNGDWLGAEIVDQMDPLTRAGLLAKSGAGRRRRGGLIPSEEMWPKGLRHEAVSFDLLQSSTGWHVDLSEGERDLVLHLAGAHHGCCRPLFPPVLDHHPTPVAVHRGDVGYSTDGRGTPIDWDHPKRFASLNATYSPWGLALLETIVRLADLWVSEEGG